MKNVLQENAGERLDNEETATDEWTEKVSWTIVSSGERKPDGGGASIYAFEAQLPSTIVQKYSLNAASCHNPDDGDCHR